MVDTCQGLPEESEILLDREDAAELGIFLHHRKAFLVQSLFRLTSSLFVHPVSVVLRTHEVLLSESLGLLGSLVLEKLQFFVCCEHNFINF